MSGAGKCDSMVGQEIARSRGQVIDLFTKKSKTCPYGYFPMATLA